MSDARKILSHLLMLLPSLGVCNQDKTGGHGCQNDSGATLLSPPISCRRLAGSGPVTVFSRGRTPAR